MMRTPAPLPLVSVITPAFNAARFIGETVRSVTMQTFSDFEMVIIDDCSDDGTDEVAAQAAGGDRRVKVVRHSRNSGPAAARNTALEDARGRFVAFLDSDDLWLPTKLEAQLRFMQEKEAPISYTSYRRISELGNIISGPIAIPYKLDYPRILKGNAIPTSTAMVDRMQVGSFRMVDTYYDDYALWLRLTKRGFVALGLQRELMYYRVVSGSVSRNKLRSARHVWEIYRSVEQLPLPRAIWCFANYAWNGMQKHRVRHWNRPSEGLRRELQ